MTKFGVGNQAAIHKNGAADAGAKGQHNHYTRLALTRAELHLGNTGGVGVVEQQHRAAGFGLE